MATWAEECPSSSAMASTSRAMASARSEVRPRWALPCLRIESTSSPSAVRVYLPVSTPPPSGAQASTESPWWRAIGSRSRSGVRSSRLYSIWRPTYGVHPRSSASTFEALTTQAGVSLTPT